MNRQTAIQEGTSMQGVTVVDHPLVQHKLTLMRDKERSTKGFRQLLNEIGMLLCYEVTRDLPMERIQIETPLTTMEGAQIAGKKLVLAPILRAGVGFLDGMLTLVPAARVAHIGLYRDPESLQAVEYYFKAPSDLADRMVLVLDPMLATANSAVAAIDRLKERGAKDLRFVSRGHREAARRTPGRAYLDRFHRRSSQRPRLYRAGLGRCRRPDVRNALTPLALYALAVSTTDQRLALHRRRLGNHPLSRLSDGGRDGSRSGLVQ
jgi:uracil phosphoribosyltransferase